MSSKHVNVGVLTGFQTRVGLGVGLERYSEENYSFTRSWVPSVFSTFCYPPKHWDWDSVPVHGLCPRPNCELPITMPPPGTAGGYTLIARRWRCVQHYFFSCKASPRGCPDPTDLWADLWDLLPHESPARERVLHVDSFDADSVRAHCMPWLLDPFSFLQGCSRSQRDAVCSVIAAFVLLVGTCVADDAVSAC
jgi:hypothetical protein